MYENTRLYVMDQFVTVEQICGHVKGSRPLGPQREGLNLFTFTMIKEDQNDKEAGGRVINFSFHLLGCITGGTRRRFVGSVIN